MTAARKRELVDQEARYRVYAMTNGFPGAFQKADEDYKSVIMSKNRPRVLDTVFENMVSKQTPPPSVSDETRLLGKAQCLPADDSPLRGVRDDIW
jgi:hypothetical protein